MLAVEKVSHKHFFNGHSSASSRLISGTELSIPEPNSRKIVHHAPLLSFLLS